MIRPWKTERSEEVGNYHVFTIRNDAKVSPRTGKTHDFFIIDCTNWVNVIAVTPQRELIMIQQYRHGSETIELEIPGGMMDPEDTSPLLAAARELREETGYEGDAPQIIGKAFPNPAIMTNTVFTVLIENCRPGGPAQLDHAEDILTQLHPVHDLASLVSSGRIQHSLVVTALYHFDLWQTRK